MPRKVIPLLASLILALVVIPPAAMAADSFSGDYSGPKLTLQIVPDGGSYAGSMHLGDQVFPIKAQASGSQLVGTFNSGGHDFPFTANLSGNNLTLTSGATTYQLTRNAANALENPPPASPINDAPQAGGAIPVGKDIPVGPAGYANAASTDVGKIWVVKKPGITTVSAALEASLRDLSTFFGNRPVIKGAFEDTKDHQSGAASFTATMAGQPIVGLLTCKLGGNEAKMSVTYCLASATQDDWKKLNADATPKPAKPVVKLNRLNFPDGTGSVGIADGWALKSGSVVDPLYVTGPADQSMGAPGLWWITVVLPDSPRIRQMQEQRRQLEESSRRLGRQPPPPLPFQQFPVVAAFAAPDQALPVVIPQWNAWKATQHLEVVTLDRITSVKPLPPGQAGWTTQLLEYDQTRIINGVPRHFHSRCTWSSMPPGASMTDQWALTPLGNMTAPVESFDRDVVTMEAMTSSIQINWDAYFKVDEERFKARLAANQIAYDERYKEQERQQVERMKEFDEHNRQWAIYENQKSRNADDWIEYAGGYRTVIDTQTGERAKVDLSNVNGIVDGLNDVSNDPHRYVQIPLRDEKDPIGAR
jgi:hypothetical protein